MGRKRPCREPVCVETTVTHAVEPFRFDDVDASCVALTEEPLSILKGCCRTGPDAPARTGSWKPERWEVTGIHGPHQRRSRRVRGRHMRTEHTEIRFLAHVPECELPFPLVRRGRITGKQVLGIGHLLARRHACHSMTARPPRSVDCYAVAVRHEATMRRAGVETIPSAQTSMAVPTTWISLWMNARSSAGVWLAGGC